MIAGIAARVALRARVAVARVAMARVDAGTARVGACVRLATAGIGLALTDYAAGIVFTAGVRLLLGDR
jgi:hypothetical protein